jgi:hypothetical protein
MQIERKKEEWKMSLRKLLAGILVFGLVFCISSSSWGQFNTQKNLTPSVSPSTTTLSPDFSAVDELLKLPKIVSTGVVNVSVAFLQDPNGSFWQGERRITNRKVRSDSIILLTAKPSEPGKRFDVVCTVSNQTAGSFTIYVKTVKGGWGGSAGERYMMPVAYAIINSPK